LDQRTLHRLVVVYRFERLRRLGFELLDMVFF